MGYAARRGAPPQVVDIQSFTDQTNREKTLPCARIFS
jgi:hypothetical protein